MKLSARCMSIVIHIVAALALAACSSVPVQPKVKTVEVKVPVPIPCVNAGEVPKRPILASNASLLAMDDYNLVLEISAERAELIAYSDQLEALIRVCQ